METKKIAVLVSLNFNKVIIEVPKNLTDEEIEELAKAEKNNMIEWEYFEITKENDND